MRLDRSLKATNSLKASAVVAKPPGTETPRPLRLPIISPSEEFLPPTCARSVSRSWCSQRTCGLKTGSGGQGDGPRAPLSRFGALRHNASMNQPRPVFFISDGTGITAETIGHSLLTQFAGIEFRTLRISFVDTRDKALAAADEIRAAGLRAGVRPIVVNSAVDPELNALVVGSGALMLDIF